jgi:hypothetical protein
VSRLAAFVDLPAQQTGGTAGAVIEEKGEPAFRIRYAPDAASIKNGHRPDLPLAEVAGLGRMTYTIDASAVPALGDINPQMC